MATMTGAKRGARAALVVALAAASAIGGSPSASAEDVGPGRPDREESEIEVTGKLPTGATSAAGVVRYVVFAQTRPCTWANVAAARPIGLDALDHAVQSNVFAFEAVLDTDVGYVCALGFDGSRRVVLFGGSGETPLHVEHTNGDEYGRLHDVAVSLTTVDPPRAIDDAVLLHYAGEGG